MRFITKGTVGQSSRCNQSRDLVEGPELRTEVLVRSHTSVILYSYSYEYYNNVSKLKNARKAEKNTVAEETHQASMDEMKLG